MKTYLFVILATIALVSFKSSETAVGVGNVNNVAGSTANDEESIKAVITAETDAYAKRDSIKLVSFYADDVVTQSAWNTGKGTFGTFKGIQEIRKNFGAAFKKDPKPTWQPTVGRSNWFFRPLGKGWMWVNFTQQMTMLDGKVYQSYETRLMKQEGSTWKIAVMYALSDHGLGPENN